MAGLPGFKGDTLPVSPGTLHGLRSFEVDVNEGTLHGVSYDEAWNGSENVATCHDDNNKERPHLLKDCDHGYWSYFGINSRYMNDGLVPAVIEGYGEVVVGEEGFRSEKARIKSIAVPDIQKLMAHREKSRQQKLTAYKFSGLEALAVGFLLSLPSIALLALVFRMDVSVPMPKIVEIAMLSTVVLLILVMLLIGVASFAAAKGELDGYKKLKAEIDKERSSDTVNWTLRQKELEAKIQKKYPHATLYPNLKEMVSAHKNDIILHGMLL